MRSQISMGTYYRSREVNPETGSRERRPLGRGIVWKEDCSTTFWYTFVPEDEYTSETYDLANVKGQAIPEKFYKPPYDPAWSKVKDPLSSDQFLKVIEPNFYIADAAPDCWPANEVGSHAQRALPT